MLAVGWWFWGQVSALAQTTTQTVFHVTIHTSQLEGHPGDPFYLQFDLTDASGTSNANSTVVITNFSFGTNTVMGANGGSLGDSVTNNTSGDLGSGVTLTDSALDNLFEEDFVPGGALSFDVYATLSLETNGVSDTFSFSILDEGAEPIPTLDEIGANALLRLTTQDGASVTVESYGTDPGLDPDAGGPPLSFGPLVTLAGSPLPAPPILAGTVSSNAFFTLQWPSAYSSFALQSSVDLLNWSSVPLTPSLSVSNFMVTVPFVDGFGQFFRLAQ